MELGSEGLGRGRKKEGLFRAGKGENKVGGGDSEVFQGWETDQLFSGQWENSQGETLSAGTFPQFLDLPFLLLAVESRFSSFRFLSLLLF